MRKFETITTVAAPYPFANVDTDRIIRIERCARTPAQELGAWAFETERFHGDGSDNPAFVLNQAPFRGAGILVAGENFGCGSSREMAVWALAGLGIRCVIAPSFGEIFFGNCFQNGVLPIGLPAATVQRLQGKLAQDPEQAILTVDLPRQRISTPWREEVDFEIEALRKQALVQGLDAIGATLTKVAAIDAFQAKQRTRRPWVYLA